VVPTAAKPANAAKTARTTSSPLTAAAGRGAAGAGPGRGAGGAGREADTGAAVPVRGAAGACAGAAGLEARPKDPAAVGGSVGSLIVGAAEGLGGKVIRTVSFFGWTLPVSFLGGTAPPGIPGMSAIILAQTKLDCQLCQHLAAKSGLVSRVASRENDTVGSGQTLIRCLTAI